MNHAIQITRVIGDSMSSSFQTDDVDGVKSDQIPLTPSELFHSGFSLLTERFKESDYGDISSPAPLEHKRNTSGPLVGIFATKQEEVLAQLCVYDAHLPVSIEHDFGHILSVFRQREKEQSIFYFGSLVVGKNLVHNIRVVGKLMREGFEFVIEKKFAMAFACVHPKHESFYKDFIGCRELGRVGCVSGLENAPGVFLYATPKTLNLKNLSRL